MKIGSTDIKSAYIGTTPVQKIYIGTTEIWSSYTYLLDEYSGAAAAYSLRKLRSGYSGSAIRVRRSNDNAEQDIGFVNNELDTSSLTSFVGSNNGFVKTWYDQSGNENDATQTTAINQPQIVSGGSVLTLTGLGSAKPILRFDGIDDSLNFIGISVSQFTSFYPQKKSVDSSKSAWFAYGQAPTTPYTPIIYGTAGIYIANNVLATNNSSYNNNNYILMSGYVDSSNNGFIQINNSTISLPSTFAGSGSNPLNSINKRTSDYSKCDVPEMILYDFDNSANISAINTNINDFYSIY